MLIAWCVSSIKIFTQNQDGRLVRLLFSEDLLVFGCAKLEKRMGIFSFARYDPHFFDPKLNVSIEDWEALVLSRACKTMCHEISHTFGMRHCIFYECIMNGSNKLEEADKKPYTLCAVCLRKL
jgi:archaemetzincin